jgi:alanyl aminopeptidase
MTGPMNRTLLACSALLAACMPTRPRPAVTSPAEPAVDIVRARPTLRLGDEAHPLGYELALEVDPAQDRFTGAVRIDVELSHPVRTIWLHAAELQILAAEVAAGADIQPVRTESAPGEFLALHWKQPIGPGKAQLRMRYRGNMHSREGGALFRRREGGEWYLFSQMEALEARRVLPCFDEPRFKVPVQLSLTVPQGLVAVANTAAVAETPLAGGRKRVDFAETPPIPSYLLALAVGPFEIVDAGVAGRNATSIRILTPRGRAAQARYAAQIAGPVLELLEDYFARPYPYGKLDQVAVPSFLGAMENPGLVTYDQSLLLSPPAEDTLQRQQSLVSTCAHELAHQWFGNLVTMPWWNDIWLNEAFATWMAAKIVERFHPEWDVPVRRVLQRDRAMAVDRLSSARVVRQPIASAHDITGAFDGITYDKGAALLHMFESWLGADEFQRRVRGYITAHAWKTATGADFLAALGEGQPELAESMTSFVDQQGTPLLTIELRCAPGRAPEVMLRQSRALPLGSRADAAQRWLVPVCLGYGVAGERHRTCQLVAQEETAITLDRAGPGACPDWVLGNDQGSAYYRVAYSETLLASLLDRSGEQLSVPERLSVLGDLRAMIAAGRQPASAALRRAALLAGAENEHLLAAAIELATVRRDLVPDGMQTRYRRYLHRQFAPVLRRIGFVPRAGESDERQLLRPRLLWLLAARAEHPQVLAWGATRARRWLEDPAAVHPELVDTALAIAAYRGDLALWQRLRRRLDQTSDRIERTRLLRAMGHFTAPVAVERNLALVAGNELELHESIGLLGAAVAEPLTRIRGWAFVREHIDTLVARMPRFGARRLVDLGQHFCDTAQATEVEAVLRPRIDRIPGGPRQLDSALESIHLCHQARLHHGPALRRFLQRS